MKRIGRGLLPLMALVVWSACSDEKPAVTTAPAATAVVQVDVKAKVSADDDAEPNARGVATLTRGNSGADVVRASIGPEGGRLRLDDFEIIVPAGAVDRATNFSIMLKGGKNKLAMAEFGPHNQLFNVPVTIILPWSGTDLAENTLAGVMWWDKKSWVGIPSSFTNDGRVSAQTIHFSWYSCGLTVAGG